MSTIARQKSLHHKPLETCSFIARQYYCRFKLPCAPAVWHWRVYIFTIYSWLSFSFYLMSTYLPEGCAMVLANHLPLYMPKSWIARDCLALACTFTVQTRSWFVIVILFDEHLSNRSLLFWYMATHLPLIFLHAGELIEERRETRKLKVSLDISFLKMCTKQTTIQCNFQT